MHWPRAIQVVLIRVKDEVEVTKFGRRLFVSKAVAKQLPIVDQQVLAPSSVSSNTISCCLQRPELVANARIVM